MNFGVISNFIPRKCEIFEFIKFFIDISGNKVFIRDELTPIPSTMGYRRVLKVFERGNPPRFGPSRIQ